MNNVDKKIGLLFFIFLICFLTSVLFWPVFIQNKIPFNANLLSSFYNPWLQEKFDGWEQGIPNKPVAKDDLLIVYPQRTLTTSMLTHFQLPFWDPYSFSGNYHLGLSETQVFYPLTVLFLFFSQINVWIFLIIIEPIIAGIGMYLFLKTFVRYEKSALLGALAFAFSGVIIVRSVEGLSSGHTLIWLPYVLWGLASFSQTKKMRFLGITLFSLMLSLLAGWFQYTFYIAILSFAYALLTLWDNTKDNSKSRFLLLLPFVLLPLLTLYHTIPAVQTLFESPRAGIEGRLFSYQHLMPFIHIVTLIMPDLWGNPAVYNYFGNTVYKEAVMFIGVIPLVFSLITLFKKKTNQEKFFIGTIIVSFLLALDNPISRAIITAPLPVVGSFLPNRIFAISTFAFCTLSAYGLDFMLHEKRDIVIRACKRVFIAVWFIVLVLVLFLAFHILQDPAVLHRVDSMGMNTNVDIIRLKNAVMTVLFLFTTTIVFFFFRKNYGKTLFFVAALAVLLVQSYLFSQKYIPFSYRQFVYPSHPVFTYLQEHQNLDRFISVGRGHIIPNIPLQFGLFSPEGVGPMYIRRYAEFIRYMRYGDFDIPDKIAVDLELSPQDIFKEENKRLYRFIELTGVKHIVVDKNSLDESSVIPEQEHFNLVWENEKWQIYEYTKSKPRFITTSNFAILPEREKILSSLFSDTYDYNKIIVEEDPGFTPRDYQGTVRVTEYTPNRITMEVTTDYPALIYFSDNYSKAFKARIDGEEGRILRANYTFRAIPITEGSHTVVVSYEDNAVAIGLVIALGTLGIVMFLSLFVKARTSRIHRLT